VLLFSSFAALTQAQGLTVPEGYQQAPQQQPAQPYAQPAYGQPVQQPPHAQLDQPPPGPQRSGFTVELSIGLAFTQTEERVRCASGPGLTCPDPGYTVFVGLAPLAVGIGGFITESFALLFRASGTSFFDSDRLIVLGHYGLAAQFWAADWLMLSIGPALALFGDLEGNADFGFGIDARVGFSFLSLAHHSFRVALELFPSFFEEFVMGESIVFEWQFY
jgi:hypothetical protein